MENRPPFVKEKLNSVVDSLVLFSNEIIKKPELYTISEGELAHNLRSAIIFYKAREDAQSET